MNKVGIVIPTYNNEMYLQRCLESLFDRTDFEDYYVIVVDNGSTDGTPAYLDELLAIHDNLTVITNGDNYGFIGGSNMGLEVVRANNDHAMLLNDDTVITDVLWLERLQFQLKDKVGAVGPVSNYAAGLQNVDLSSQLPDVHEANLLVGFCFLIRADALKTVGLLDPLFGDNMFEDFDYSMRLKEAGFELYVERETFVYHYGSRTLKRDEAAETFNAKLLRGEQILIGKWGFTRWQEANSYPKSLNDWLYTKMREAKDSRVEGIETIEVDDDTGWVEAYTRLKPIAEDSDGSIQTVRYYKLNTLFLLAQAANGKNIVELGSATGVSTFALALGAPDSTIFGTDHYEVETGAVGEKYSHQDMDKFFKNMKTVGVTNVGLRAVDVREAVRFQTEPVGLLFWDIYGDRLLDDFKAWESKVAPGGTFAVKLLTEDDSQMEALYSAPGWHKGPSYPKACIFTAVKAIDFIPLQVNKLPLEMVVTDEVLFDSFKRAAFWVVDDQRFLEEAVKSAESVQEFLPKLDRVLFIAPSRTTQGISGLSRFTHTVSLSARQSKLWYLDYLRYLAEIHDWFRDNGYEEVVEFDSDVRVVKPAMEMFEMLRRYDIAMAVAPGHRTAPTVEHVPDCYSEYNTGVVVQDVSEKVQNFWGEIAAQLEANQEIYGDNDQAPLREYLWNIVGDAWVNIGTLTPEYNARFPFGLMLTDPVKILHGRLKDGELRHYLSLAVLIDNTEGVPLNPGLEGNMRVWKP